MRPYRHVAGGPGYDVTAWNDGKIELLLSSWSSDVADAAAEHQPSSVRILGEWDSDEASIAFLLPIARNIHELMVDSPNIRQFAALDRFPVLESLGVSSAATVPFHALPTLRSFWLGEGTDYGDLASVPALHELTFAECKLRALSVVRHLASLRRLRVAETAITSVAGLENTALTWLDLQINPRLTSIEGLTGLPLRELQMMGSRKMTDLSPIGSLRELERLAISTGPAIASFEFLGSLAQLRRLHIGATRTAGTPCSLAPIAALRGLRECHLIGGSERMADLTDIEQLANLSELESLILTEGPKELSSLHFLRPLTGLRRLYLKGSVIRDGDLTPILGLRSLTSLSILPFRKHYSHTKAELAAATGIQIS